MNKTAFSAPTTPQISFSEYCTIMKAQTRYTLKYTRIMIDTATRKASTKIHTAYETYKTFLDDGDNDVCEMTAKQIIIGSIAAILIGFVLCFSF